jgi:IS30 family transposase
LGIGEGDTIIGSHNGGAVIASMVERKSRYTFLSKAKNKTTTAVISSINNNMLAVTDLVFTITEVFSKSCLTHRVALRF